MHFIPTTPDLFDQFKAAAKHARKTKTMTKADSLNHIANAYGYHDWNHVMWCLNETYTRIRNADGVRANIINHKEPFLNKEIDYIVAQAEAGECTIVRLWSMILFSSADGDGWLLDMRTNRALCLCWHGERQAISVSEDAEQIRVHYDSEFEIRGGAFCVSSDNACVGQRAISNAYPVKQILALIGETTGTSLLASSRPY